MELIKFIFSGFWIFIGSFMIIGLFVNAIVILINRILRHANIRKHGYPPPHCDGDGDFKDND